MHPYDPADYDIFTNLYYGLRKGDICASIEEQNQANK